MKFFVLATCHKLDDHCSFIVENTNASKCFVDAQNEIKRRCEKAGVYMKYVIVQFTRVE
jgi:hypothetical protein|uniref:Uncharacterized protein n=1 Tax=Siphoviridae sp. ctFRY1 TaxID=2827820 RepID=A0A8S5SUC4_9CAUD|nr:MAG TPA: hypothetical protein [Siphoviridae sp. ctFRY1]